MAHLERRLAALERWTGPATPQEEYRRLVDLWSAGVIDLTWLSDEHLFWLVVGGPENMPAGGLESAEADRILVAALAGC